MPSWLVSKTVKQPSQPRGLWPISVSAEYFCVRRGLPVPSPCRGEVIRRRLGLGEEPDCPVWSCFSDRSQQASLCGGLNSTCCLFSPKQLQLQVIACQNLFFSYLFKHLWVRISWWKQKYTPLSSNYSWQKKRIHTDVWIGSGILFFPQLCQN